MMQGIEKLFERMAGMSVNSMKQKAETMVSDLRKSFELIWEKLTLHDTELTELHARVRAIEDHLAIAVDEVLPAEKVETP